MCGKLNIYLYKGSGIKDESVDQLRQDRDRFKSDLERVSAQLQGRIKRLQERLSQYEESKEPKDLVSDLYLTPCVSSKL